MSEDIHNLLKQKERRLVAPLAGLPGVPLIGQTVLACLQDHRLHVRAISALQEAINADLAFTPMDFTVEAEAIGLKIRFEPQRAPVVTSPPVDNHSSLSKIHIIPLTNIHPRCNLSAHKAG